MSSRADILADQNPWELPRLDVQYEVRFYGSSERANDGSGRAVWSGGQEVLAVAYDVMIPGYGTRNTNNLRLWESKPKRGFDLQSFNAGDYEHAIEASNSAAAITSVLYPNDHTSCTSQYRFCRTLELTFLQSEKSYVLSSSTSGLLRR